MLKIRTVILLIVFFLVVPLQALAQNKAPLAFKGMELYSWKDSASNSWSFSLLPGTNRNKSLIEIKEPSHVISSIEQLEKYFDTLAEGEQVFWFRAGFKTELSYPDQETISRILQFAAKRKITVLIE